MSKSLLAIVLVGALLSIGLGILKLFVERRFRAPERFRSRPLLTPNELDFLGRLEAAVPELRFCPQVSMGALLEPAVPKSQYREYLRARGRFSQKVVDFVAQSRLDGSVVAIIELDDRTHDIAKDRERDRMMASAGYRTVRWDSRKKPDADAIRLALLGLQALAAK